MRKLIFVVCLLVIAACSGCRQSQQEEDGVSLLPQNRPTASDMRRGMGIPLNY